jgi:hypothetical protein
LSRPLSSASAPPANTSPSAIASTILSFIESSLSNDFSI